MEFKVKVLTDGEHPIFKSEGIGGIFSALAFVMNILTAGNRKHLTIVIEKKEN
jgi:hypothetical protein